MSHTDDNESFPGPQDTRILFLTLQLPEAISYFELLILRGHINPKASALHDIASSLHLTTSLNMRWTAPPERREIILILFSISAYLLAYNFETSLGYVGIDPAAAQGALYRRIGLGKTKILGRDGRKPAGWRDKLENQIFGSWDWEEGHIAGDASQRNQMFRGRGKHGAQWMERKAARSLDHTRFGDDTVNGAHVWWKDDVPVVTVLKHVPGE